MGAELSAEVAGWIQDLALSMLAAEVAAEQRRALQQRLRHQIKEASGQLQEEAAEAGEAQPCLLYTSPSPRDVEESRMPSSA